MAEPQENEKRLVELAQAGDRPAFTQLVQQCSGQIFNLAFRLCGNRADADDLSQEAFLHAYRNLCAFRHESAFSSWVYRITMNIWKNTVRYEKRRHFSQHDSFDGPASAGGRGLTRILPDCGPDPSEQLERAADRRAAEQALDVLDAQERAVIVLSDIEQKSYAEIAALLRCPVGTVRSRLSRARERLRQAFEKISGEGA